MISPLFSFPPASSPSNLRGEVQVLAAPDRCLGDVFGREPDGEAPRKSWEMHGKMMENHGTSLQISWNMVDLTKKHSKAFGFDGMCN